MKKYIFYAWEVDDEGGIAICFSEKYEKIRKKRRYEFISKIGEFDNERELSMLMMSYNESIFGSSKDFDYYQDEAIKMIKSYNDLMTKDIEDDVYLRARKYDEISSLLKKYNAETSCMEDDYCMLKDVINIINK